MKNKFKHKKDGTTTIYINYHGRNLETRISTTQFELANTFPNTWFAVWDWDSRTYYVCGQVTVKGKRQKLYLHRVVTQCPERKQVHHVNKNGLDNTNGNLENVTSGEHCQKTSPKDTPILGDRNGKMKIHILEKARLNENGERLWFDVEVNGIFFGSFHCMTEVNLTVNIAYDVMNEGVSDKDLIDFLGVRMKHDAELIEKLTEKVRKYVRIKNSTNEGIAC